MDERAQVICLTPTKNEEWIIERFVDAASMWADRIIIADQMSTDRTVEIAKRNPKVYIIQNQSETFNENERQKILINEARKFSGKKLLIALDADEFLTGNFFGNPEWSHMLNAKEGTVFQMRWPFVKDNFKEYWEAEEPFNVFAVMDDGSPHVGTPMHSIRIPFSKDAPHVFLSDIRVMHFQFTDWKRMERKHLWYQCYEHIKDPQKSVSEIYRLYHHMYVSKQYKEIPDNWFAYYDEHDIMLRQNTKMTEYWWDSEIQQFLSQHGSTYFKYIDFEDNHNFILSYLRKTQRLYKGRYGKAVLHRLDKLIEKGALFLDRCYNK